MPDSSPTHPSPELVSVVIPCLNAAGTLGLQLEALARQRTDRPYEVIVADNGSTDGTAAVVAAYRDRVPGLRLVDASRRRSSNTARNEGTAAAGGEMVLLCDADDVVADDWLEALARGLEQADAVGGPLEYVELNPDFVAQWGEHQGQGGMAVQLGFLPRPVGANAGFRKSVWEKLGGFDEDYVRGGPETEFFWRLQLAGHSLLEVPEAVVHYRLRSSFKALVRQMYVWGRQSPMLYRQFREHGMPRNSRESARMWLWLVKHLPDLLGKDPYARLKWCRQAAYRVGRIVGSVSYRVVYP